MKLTDGIIPNTEEWILSRLGKITASEIHKLFVKGQGKDKLIGIGGVNYLNKKIGEILTQVMSDNVPETEDVLRGLGHEKFAIERYSILTNETVYDSKLFNYNAIAAGTTDGQTSNDGINIKGIIEAKCPRANKHIQVLSVDAAIELKDIDPQYYHQPQANILFTGAEYADFISYNDEIKHYDLQIRVIRVYPDMDWRKQLVDIIDYSAEYMDNKLTKILKAPERNLALRFEKNPEQFAKLQTVIDNITNIAI